MNAWWSQQRWPCICNRGGRWVHVHRHDDALHSCAACAECHEYRPDIPEHIAVRILLGPDYAKGEMTDEDAETLLLGKPMTPEPKSGTWEFFCEHANENPNVCPCPATCGCRWAHCKGKPLTREFKEHIRDGFGGCAPHCPATHEDRYGLGREKEMTLAHPPDSPMCHIHPLHRKPCVWCAQASEMKTLEEREKEKESLPKVSPWRPEQNLMRLARLGKLAEELGEASAIVARCIIQGIDECEPVTKKLNREALEDELADVLASIDLNIEFFGLDQPRMAARKSRKVAHKKLWNEEIKSMMPWGR